MKVYVKILFGKIDSLLLSEAFILKNRTESELKGDGKLVKGGKEGKSYWLLIVIALVLVAALLIVLNASMILDVRLWNAKNEAEYLRKIENDNIRKDPKAFGMVTMEILQEEQWRREWKKRSRRIWRLCEINQ